MEHTQENMGGWGGDNSFKEFGYKWEQRNGPVGRGECRDRERLLKMGNNTVCFQMDEKDSVERENLKMKEEDKEIRTKSSSR